MSAQERAQEIVSAILDACRIDAADKRPQLEALVMTQLNEIERQAAEKAVVLDPRENDGGNGQTVVGNGYRVSYVWGRPSWPSIGPACTTHREPPLDKSLYVASSVSRRELDGFLPPY